MMQTREKTCPVCKIDFNYTIGKGKDRKHCSPNCRSAFRLARNKSRQEVQPPCSTPGCVKRISRLGAGRCEACYCYQKRTGKDPVARLNKTRKRCRTKQGYIKLWSPTHPLADSSGLVFEHRLVVYNLCEGSCPGCFWCGITLDWSFAVIDHLNEQKDDNRPENLVVACNDCNRARGAIVPFIRGLRPESLAPLIESFKAMRCHDAKTAAFDGGFGRPCRES